MTFEDPRKVLARHGLRPKRAFSQNFLCSPRAIAAIAEAAIADTGHTVVELGPGCGTLTQALLDRGARVVAIERDPQMRTLLAEEFGAANLDVRDGDAAEVDYRELQTEFGAPLRVAGNLPYSITGAILRRLIDDAGALHCAVVMVQREVADRLLASPGTGAYGALSVFAENVFEVKRITHVPRGAFHPPPNVDSTVVKLHPRPQPLTPPDALFQSLIRATFQARRKTLRNALAKLPMPGNMSASDAMALANIDPSLRGERLHVTDFGRLAEVLRVHFNPR